MKTTDNGRAARARNAKRLRSFTIGTALMGILATGGFGALAAVTYSGTTPSGSATTAATTNGGTVRGTGPLVGRSSGTGHATTGGS